MLHLKIWHRGYNCNSMYPAHPSGLWRPCRIRRPVQPPAPCPHQLWTIHHADLPAHCCFLAAPVGFVSLALHLLCGITIFQTDHYFLTTSQPHFHQQVHQPPPVHCHKCTPTRSAANFLRYPTYLQTKSHSACLYPITQLQQPPLRYWDAGSSKVKMKIRISILTIAIFSLCSSICLAQQKSIKALVGGTLIDGYGSTPIRNSVVIIEGERIKAVGQVDRSRYRRAPR